MRGPGNLEDILNGVLREAKTASVAAPEPAPSSLGENMRKVASVLRGLPDAGEFAQPSYADLYTVKEALYGR